jgi:predicted AlkP superfamily phosphohydrolase/phosphomutase
VVVERSKAIAVASGGAMNVYINLAGREENGIVPAAGYAAVHQQVIDLFAGLLDSETGEPVFQHVVTGDDLAALGLGHPNSGDVFAQARPGYNLDGYRGLDELFTPSRFYGQHGYSSSLPEMQTPFIAAGAGVPSLSEDIPPVSILDLAPTLAALLGFEPAVTVDGEAIPAIVHP